MTIKRIQHSLLSSALPRFISAFLAALLGVAAVSSQHCWGQSGRQSQHPTTSATSPIEFEVATIKESEPGKLGADIGFKGHIFYTSNQTVKSLIAFAYNTPAYRITGGPAWIDTNKYDILAEAPSERPLTFNDRMPIQLLLKDRFGLKFHLVKRPAPAYQLVIDGNRLKLQRSSSEYSGLALRIGRNNERSLPAKGATMAQFADMLGHYIDRPVVDRTGLNGTFDFTLNWAPDDLVNEPENSPDSSASKLPSLFTAIREQLGLRLDRGTEPADVLVIEQVHKPTPN